MQLTKKELLDMKNIDIRTVDRSTLVQRASVEIDSNASREERIINYIEKIKNPYCYLDGKNVVKISYTEGDRTLEEDRKSVV